MTFTVDSNPPLAENTVHVLRKTGGGVVTKRFKVERNCITFRDMRVEDSGMYTISCCNSVGQEGSETLELEVVGSDQQHPAPNEIIGKGSSESKSN